MITRFFWFILILFLPWLSGYGAENDVTYLQTNSEGKKVERTLTITPETVLTVNDQGRIVVLGYPAILGNLDVFDDDSNGLVPMVDGYSVPLEVPSGTAVLTPSGWGVAASQSAFFDHANDTDNPHEVTAAQLGLEDATLLGNPTPPSPVAAVFVHWDGAKLEFGPGAAPMPWGNLDSVPQNVVDLADLSSVENLLDVAALSATPYGLSLLEEDSGTIQGYIGLDQVENVALSTWGGSTNIDTLGTITTGTWTADTVAVLHGGTGATNEDDARANLVAAKSGANTDITSLSGGDDTLEITANLDVADTLTADTVEIGPTSWSYNPTGSGQLEITFPGGVAAMYETGSPAAPYFYFPGTIYCDLLEASELDGSVLTGVIPQEVINNSVGGLLYAWTEPGAEAAGVDYDTTGPLGANEPVPALATYFPNVYVIDGGTESTNSLSARYRTKEQFNGDLMPTASAAIDWPSIAAGGQNTQTLTVTGAVTTNTPTVTVGWSAALEAGLIVSQAWVSGANTVSITLTNITGGAIDPASLTVRAAVQQF